MKICLASPDFVGPIRNGGVGTAFLGLAEVLISDPDVDVTLLYTSDIYQVGDESHWRAHYSAQGLTFHGLPKLTENVVVQRLDGGEDYILRSYRLMRYLQINRYDILHIPDYLGLGYFTIMMKRLGLDFQDMPIVVTAHGPVAWSRLNGYMTYTDLKPLVSQHLERYVVENADTLISPSLFLLTWLQQHGWKLPDKRVHAFNALPGQTSEKTRGNGGRLPDTLVQPNELVFFGRIEQRKGIYLFLDALKQLTASHPELLNKTKITFLGGFNEGSVSRKLFATRMMSLDIEWQVIEDFDTEQAQQYLLNENRLAVIPSLMDNSPCTIAECLYRCIPFIASDVGGNGELISNKELIFNATADSLAQKLVHALTKGVPISSSVQLPTESRETLLDLHKQIFESNKQKTSNGTGQDSLPLVSVCLVHQDRPNYLKEALDGFESQTYKHFEVLIGDNGSVLPETQEFLLDLERQSYYSYSIRVFRFGKNLFPSGARNLLATYADGEILKFHDDDNISKSHELETFVRALRSGGELVTTALDFFDDDDCMTPGRQSKKIFLSIGDGGGISYFSNVMGDTNFAVWKNIFQSFGGFDDLGFLYHAEDWLVLAKAKAHGVKIETIADPLVWYRADRFRYSNNWRKQDIGGARFRAVMALSSHLPEEVRHALLYACGSHHKGN